MPGYDRTGPRGQGPLTGGGFGYCAVPVDRQPVQSVPVVRPPAGPYTPAYGYPRYGYGMGMGRGMGMGWRRGGGRGRGRGGRGRGRW